MGKISPQSIKYVIKAKFTAEGLVEKPDVIGAVFGQTEGLLGEELDLRDLQKKGKIGRINAEMEVSNSKTTGIVEIPTSIDRTETTIIAAAIETIDRIGPCEAKFEIESIDDVRSSKREYIVERAKKLLEKLSSNTPEMREMEKDISDYRKTAKIQEYGKEMLSSGPSIDESEEVIVVEGRADVLNLLRCDIKNCIAMNGNIIPETIKKLSQSKSIILFIDGDRGGILNAKDAIENAKIAFVARAPDGKEVEELTEKEIITCLRNRLIVEDFVKKYIGKGAKRKKNEDIEKEINEEPLNESEKESEDIDNAEDILSNYMEEIEGTKSSLILSINKGSFQVIQKVAISNIIRTIYNLKKRNKNIDALVIDGTVTVPIVRTCERVSCKYIAAKGFATTSSSIKMISL